MNVVQEDISSTWRKASPARVSGGAPALDLARLPPGFLLRDLVLEARIGRGGFGVVYRARRERSLYAVKLPLIEAPAGDEGTRAFAQELLPRVDAEIASLKAIRHPNVVPVSEFFSWNPSTGAVGEDDGLPVLVMPFVDGPPLDAWVAEGRPSLRAVLSVFRDLGSALAEVHRRSFVHRDVKPSNILVQAGGKPMLIDFGIAKGRSLGTVTSAGNFVGTVDFLAPEFVAYILSRDFVAGKPFSFGPAQDIYALGHTLYQTLTGASAWSAYKDILHSRDFSLELAEVHKRGVIPAPSSINPAVPRELDALVLAMLARDPAVRLPSARAVADAIDELMRAAPSPSPAYDEPFEHPSDEEKAARFGDSCSQLLDAMNASPSTSSVAADSRDSRDSAVEREENEQDEAGGADEADEAGDRTPSGRVEAPSEAPAGSTGSFRLPADAGGASARQVSAWADGASSAELQEPAAGGPARPPEALRAASSGGAGGAARALFEHDLSPEEGRRSEETAHRAPRLRRALALVAGAALALTATVALRGRSEHRAAATQTPETPETRPSGALLEPRELSELAPSSLAALPAAAPRLAAESDGASDLDPAPDAVASGPESPAVPDMRRAQAPDALLARADRAVSASPERVSARRGVGRMGSGEVERTRAATANPAVDALVQSPAGGARLVLRPDGTVDLVAAGEAGPSESAPPPAPAGELEDPAPTAAPPRGEPWALSAGQARGQGEPDFLMRAAPVAAPAAQATPRRLGVSVGTELSARLVRPLSSTSEPCIVVASLSRPLVTGGAAVLPSGTMFYGSATVSSSGERLNVQLTRLKLPGGEEFPIQAVAFDAGDRKPGLLPSRRELAAPGSSAPPATAALKATAHLAVAKVAGAAGEAGELVRTAGQELVDAAAAGKESGVGHRGALSLDAPAPLTIFVTEAF